MCPVALESGLDFPVCRTQMKRQLLHFTTVPCAQMRTTSTDFDKVIDISATYFGGPVPTGRTP